MSFAFGAMLVDLSNVASLPLRGREIVRSFVTLHRAKRTSGYSFAEDGRQCVVWAVVERD